MTVPFASPSSTLRDIASSAAGKIVVDTTVLRQAPPKVAPGAIAGARIGGASGC